MDLQGVFGNTLPSFQRTFAALILIVMAVPLSRRARNVMLETIDRVIKEPPSKEEVDRPVRICLSRSTRLCAIPGASGREARCRLEFGWDADSNNRRIHEYFVRICLILGGPLGGRRLYSENLPAHSSAR